jgi:hypothetical protein
MFSAQKGLGIEDGIPDGTTLWLFLKTAGDSFGCRVVAIVARGASPRRR